MAESVWNDHPEFASAADYEMFERAICESIWTGQAQFLSSEWDYSPCTSVWDGVSCLFFNFRTRSVWELVKPDWPSRGSFKENPDLDQASREVQERVKLLMNVNS